MLRDLIMASQARGNTRTLVIGSLVVVAAISATDAMAHKKVRQPTRGDLATVWVGGGGDETIEYFRLELDTNGAGLLTIQYLPGKPATAYRVVATALSGYAIALELKPVDDFAQLLDVRGEANPDLLRLEIKCRSPKWTRRVNLERYDELLGRIRAVTERADAYARVAQ